MTDQNREETPDIVAQVRAALEGITPLPWQVLHGVPPNGRADEHFVGDAAAAALWDFRGAMDNAQDAHAIVTLMNAAPQLLALIDELRTSKSALHRRAQAAEGVLKARRQPKAVDTWASPERQQEAADRDRMMDASRRRTTTGDTMSEQTVERFWCDLAEWSTATFGSDADRGPVGPLKHLRKEATEAIRAALYVKQCHITADVAALREEIGDCFSISIDAARRAGMTLDDLVAECYRKLAVNKARSWPRPTSDEPVEHVR